MNLADGLTKETTKTQLNNFYEGGKRSLMYDKDMVSARKRRKQSQQPLDEPDTEDRKDVLDPEDDERALCVQSLDEMGEDVLDPEGDERALCVQNLDEMRETTMRLDW